MLFKIKYFVVNEGEAAPADRALGILQGDGHCPVEENVSTHMNKTLTVNTLPNFGGTDMILSVWLRGNGWRLVGGGLLAVGAVAAHSGSARAHLVISVPGCASCGPHGYCDSKGGTQFSNCIYTKEYTEKGKEIRTYTRDIACAAGTGCSNALCGGKAVVDGTTAQKCRIDSKCGIETSYKHGVPPVSGLVCGY